MTKKQKIGAGLIMLPFVVGFVAAVLFGGESLRIGTLVVTAIAIPIFIGAWLIIP